MNPELPPLSLQAPKVNLRRREKKGPIEFVPIPKEKRQEIAKRILREIDEVRKKVSSLTPEQKRAVFLKLRHDRPLKMADLAGLGLHVVGSPGEEETLVIDKKGDLAKMESRANEMRDGEESKRPKNNDLLACVTTIEIGAPLDRASQSFKDLYASCLEKDYNVYLIEITSQHATYEGRRKEVVAIRLEILNCLGAGISGDIFDTDFQEDGAQMMLWSNGAKLREFVEASQWQRKITYFDILPKFETFSQTLRDFNVGQTTILPPSNDAEKICVIDSGIAGLNPFLSPIVLREISRSWVYGKSPLEDACGHGSGVASLAAYHTIDPSMGSTHQAQAWIASARIMNDDGELDTPQSGVPDEDRRNECKLLATILREIVEHFTQHGVCVFVLSFEIRGQSWSLAGRGEVSRNSWVARTIDQLSAEYDIVFCCITGNINHHDVQDLIAEHGYPNYLTSPLAKLLDPGQAALAITSGSIAHSVKVTGGRHTPIAGLDKPSPFSRTGYGFGDSIKPDVVEYGGNLVRDSSGTVFANLETNVLMASGQLLKPLSHGAGTSFSAPRVAYHLARIMSDLRSMGVAPSNALVRALLANSAAKIEVDASISKGDNLRMVGYGLPRRDQALECKNHSVLLFWSGTLRPYHSAIFRIPVPEEFANYPGTKKLISISLAITPPVQKWGVCDYLGVTPKFWLFRGDEEPAAIEQMLQREQDEENVAGKGVSHLTMDLGISARTTGALQFDRFEWTMHKKAYSQEDYLLAVSLSKPAKWVRDEPFIPIAIAVRLEDYSGRFSSLYSQVRQRVEVRVKT